MNNEQKIEALLFYKAEPVSLKELEKITEVSAEEIQNTLNSLEISLSGRGVRLMRKDDFVEIRTAPEVSSFIERLVKAERVRDLGKAGLETLAIVVYKGPVSRRDIDYIRGVNSGFILRNLMIRGLVERISPPNEKRSFQYRATFDLLGHLGIDRIESLPDFEKIETEIENFKNKEVESVGVENIQNE